MRLSAARFLGRPVDDVVLERTCERCGANHGRPRIAGDTAYVSISHAADIVAVAVTAIGPVGVDVESIRAVDDYHELVDEICAPEERSTVGGPFDFCLLWSRKEAVLKATGHGLRIPMDQVLVTPPGRPPELRSIEGRPRASQLFDLDPGPGYVGAVAVLMEDQGPDHVNLSVHSPTSVQD